MLKQPNSQKSCLVCRMLLAWLLLCLAHILDWLGLVNTQHGPDLQRCSLASGTTNLNQCAAACICHLKIISMISRYTMIASVMKLSHSSTGSACMEQVCSARGASFDAHLHHFGDLLVP